MRSGFPAVLFAWLLAFAAWAQSWAYDDGTVPFVVTPEEVVDRMLRIADVGPNDFLIDLGSGDGRIVIEAAKRGARGLGVDLDPELVKRSTANARAAGVAERVRFEVRDLFETDLGAASVITLYLLPEVNLKLMPKLLRLKPGTRIVSHDWNMGPWPPDETIELRTPDKTVGRDGLSRVHLWLVPADARGTWTAEVPAHGGRWQFTISQQFQTIEVDTRAGGSELVVRGARLRGEEIRIVVTGLVAGKPWNHRFHGKLSGARIDGELQVSDGENNRTYPWVAIRMP
ncbi:MAG: class I SAM-dependent methyltransferase [Betaproteobacteria bacterium]|nr:class I SAM-dependent methyltransferase [Betaproteobacteria bacterium]